MNDLFYALDITPLMDDEAACARAYAAVKDADRREKLDRIKVKRERCLSLGGTLLLQKALGERGIGAPALAYGEQGKPFLKNRPDRHFNISHSGDHVICVFSDAPVGCDIERIRPGRERVAARCFSPEENAALAALTGEAEKADLFFRFWTLKESFLKAVGCGITASLSAVSFDLSGFAPAVRQTIAPGTFFFREYGDIPGYRVSLCKTADGPFPPLEKIPLTEVI